MIIQRKKKYTNINLMLKFIFKEDSDLAGVNAV